ncbi:unnamed protein product [Penicillium glandicola]
MSPVTDGQFSFNVDTFYVAASGGQIHRRAAPAEIKALYDTATTDKSTPDHPGHWYEAQLLHYGLPPSKVKATAKMRLLKAVQDGVLSVPKESLQIEKNLKKEWKKQESSEQPQANTRTTMTKTVVTKTITVSKTVASKTTGSKVTASKAAAKLATVKATTTKAVTPKAAAPKKDTTSKTVAPKVTAAKTTVTKAATNPATTKPAPKAAAIKAVAKPAAVKPTTAKTATPNPAPKKFTALKTAVSKATPTKSATPQTAPAKRKRASNNEETPNQPQTAKRRSYGNKVQDNTNVLTNSYPGPSGWSEQPEYQDAPPSYESDCGMDGEHPYNASDNLGHYGEYEAHSDPPSPPRTLKNTLGLLNGTYQVRSPDIEDKWPHAMPSEGITLSLRLNGREIWGTYEFGMFEGVLWMPERPMKPSFERFPFKWRGRETGEGEMSFADDQEGWIEFLGDGDIVGMISCCEDLHFRGQRIDSSVRTASDLRNEWDGYNEEEYGRESRARWGRW